MAKGKFNMGGGMAPNMANLMKQAQKMQETLTQAQEDLAKKSYQATSGGGAVDVTIDGSGKIINLVIDESVLDDAAMVADLVIAAVHQAVEEKDKQKEDTLGSLTGGIGNFGSLF